MISAVIKHLLDKDETMVTTKFGGDDNLQEVLFRGSDLIFIEGKIKSGII